MNTSHLHEQKSASNSDIASAMDGRLSSLKQFLRASYSDSSVSYDLERSVSARVLAYFEYSYQTINALIGPTSEKTVQVDLPVGTGRLVEFLRMQGRNHRILGIDIAPGMITVASYVSRNDPKTKLCFGDAFHLPLPDGTVDVLSSLRFFHLFPKIFWPDLLIEMQRVLRPGGLLITDMRNLFRGGIGGLLKEYRDRWLFDDQAHSFVTPPEIARLFKGWTDLHTRGVGLDGAWTLSAVAPGLADCLENLASQSALRYLTKELIVAARKPVK